MGGGTYQRRSFGKLLTLDSDNDGEEGLLRNPFSSHLKAPNNFLFTTTQGAVCSTPGGDDKFDSLARILVPGSVAPLASIVSTKVPGVPSIAAVVSPSPVSRKR